MQFKYVFLFLLTATIILSCTERKTVSSWSVYLENIGTYSSARTTDLNSDGIDELLMITGDMAQGTLTEMASLVSFQNGRRHVIQDFGSVVLDSCASGFPSSTSEASVIYISDVAPGAMPKITQENYSSPCRKTKRWRLVSRGKKE